MLTIDRAGAALYDEASDSWRQLAQPTPRYYHTATALPDGAVLVVGGQDGTVYSSAPSMTSVALYCGAASP